MKRILIVVAAGLFLTLLSPHRALAFGTKDVVTMTKSGVPDSLIITKIQHSGATFHLNARDLAELAKAGVSNEVVGAMLRTEDQGNAGACYACDPWWPYDPSWRVGLDFGFYAPRYHPIYVGPYPHRVFVRGGFRGRT
jgi:hypothetical protein